EKMAGKCPRCGVVEVRVLRGKHSAASGSARIECAGCGRFLGWSDQEIRNLGRMGDATQNVAAAGQAVTIPEGVPATIPGPVSDPIPVPDCWLYVSKRLDLEWVPVAPIWSAPAIWFTTGTQPTPTPHYPLTPAVIPWLERAGEQLELRAAAPNARGDDVNQAAEFVRLMKPVWDFARDDLSAAEVSRARRQRPVEELPEVVMGPALDGSVAG